MDHDSVVDDWRKHAAKNDERNYRFLRSLKHRDYGLAVDAVAAELHERAFGIVDCTRCVNCCKTMTVRLDQPDIDRIAEHLGMTARAFTEAHLQQGEDGDLPTLRQQPCPFLGGDHRCTVYEVRPACCREYPHTDKDGFATRTMLHANNARECPAVFWIVEQLRVRATGRSHGEG